MEFPDHLDKEDMELAIKEWRLSGLDIGLHHHGETVENLGVATDVDIWDVHFDDTVSLLGWYIRKSGSWYFKAIGGADAVP